jgi:hypothetical protein
MGRVHILCLAPVVVYSSGISACSSMDRAPDFESVGWGFESLQARQRSSRREGAPGGFFTLPPTMADGLPTEAPVRYSQVFALLCQLCYNKDGI